MQWNIWAAPRVLRRRKVISVGFAGYFEHGDFDAFRYVWAASEPLAVGPALYYGFRISVASFGFLLHVVERIEYQDGFL